MGDNKIALLRNHTQIPLKNIPVLRYTDFYREVIDLLNQDTCHCVNYYGFLWKNRWKFICCIADDAQSNIAVLSHEQDKNCLTPLLSLAKVHSAMSVFEREIYENFNIVFEAHPWPKPLRYSFDRKNKEKCISNYPFYAMESPQLHEVGVGPIHAGIIEPGHFRFICNGEHILNLEIQLGYQHRGVEYLFREKKHILERMILAESITGDTTIGHALSFAGLMETLAQIKISNSLSIQRTLALEMERIAMHVGGLGGMCMDVAYPLGGAVFGSLRTPIINFLQQWCGSRFGRGLIRVGGTHYPLNTDLKTQLEVVLTDFETKFQRMSNKIFSTPGVLARFEDIGRITKQQVQQIGAIGMVARSVGLRRDVRCSHPFLYFKEHPYQPILLKTGDVLARAMLRRKEIELSISLIRQWLKDCQKIDMDKKETPVKNIQLKPESFSISLIEGWRGEIGHCVVTDCHGEINHYKIKDPSLHNWMALELAVRHQEISDFPICNKSFDLSYCGFDL